MGRILAIDYGRKKIGLAVTDETRTVISTLERILNNEKVWENLGREINGYDPDLIVIGYPVSYEEKTSHFQQEVLNFQKKISSLTQKKTVLHDESYTSKMAEQVFVQSRGKKKTVEKKVREKKEKIDSLAAHLILKSFLKFP